MWIKTTRDLGQLLRDERERRNWTQVEMAQQLGTSRHSVLRLETGRPVGADIVLRAASLLGLVVDIRHPDRHPTVEVPTVDVDAIIDRARRK